jgi:hypothetical protein
MADDFDPRARRTYFLTEDERIVRPEDRRWSGRTGGGSTCLRVRSRR